MIDLVSHLLKIRKPRGRRYILPNALLVVMTGTSYVFMRRYLLVI